MIFDALAAQFQQRFDHEKRARVCLWFDEKKEFRRLLPAFRDHLARKGGKSPFVLLEYDPSVFHGQIWIRHEIYRKIYGRQPGERAAERFLVYFPLSEERLEKADDRGEHHLELLTEYRVGGLIWRVGGRRPTLFSFLRQAGVNLPENPQEQRRLRDGGEDSLLAKYAAKFCERPREFWAAALTPEMARSGLVGDVDQTLFDMALDPGATWSRLQSEGLRDEFLVAMRERYGFDAVMNEPADWVRGFVTVSALTETFLGYGEPPDFPFHDRLPPAALRDRHVELLRRWLRDSENRPVWDRRIAEVESGIDLSAWASRLDGLSFAFPHLVRRRWERLLEAFERASGRESELSEFFEKYSPVLRKEVEFSRSGGALAGSWDALASLGRLRELVREANERILKEEDIAGLARLYLEFAPKVDLLHLAVRRQASELELPSIGRVADRVHADYANLLNGRFFEFLAARGSVDVPGVPPVSEKIEAAVWKARGRRAMVIVDSLRYDCAHAIKEALPGLEIQTSPLRAMLPAVTATGMTALLPLSGADLKVDCRDNQVRPMVNGRDMSQRQNRIEHLSEFGAQCLDIDRVEETADPPEKLGELLVVFGHEVIDRMGHGNADVLIRHLHLEIERLARLVRKLHHWGYPVVHIVTDHGFILVDPDRLPPEIPCDKAWCRVLKERFALIPAHADLPLVSFPLEWDETLRVAVPPGTAFFRRERSFSHGGATLQELIVPHLVSRSRAKGRRPFHVDVAVADATLMQGVVRVALRAVPEAADAPVQLGMYAAAGRTIRLDVLRTDETGLKKSVLAGGGAKEVRLDPAANREQKVNLFFHTALRFQAGELLDLDIRDAETGEQFPSGGLRVSIGRTM